MREQIPKNSVEFTINKGFEMPRIKVIEHEDAQGDLKEVYDSLLKSRGKLAAVHKIQSLRPKSITAHMDLYMEIMFSRSELSRAQREMIGVVVSYANGCKYCTRHHAHALNFYWKDDIKTEKLINGNFTDILSESDRVLCDLALSLTLEPGKHEKNDFIEVLKERGYSDEAVLDVVLVISYFNFVNRIVLSLGVAFDENEAKGYNY